MRMRERGRENMNMRKRENKQTDWAGMLSTSLFLPTRYASVSSASLNLQRISFPTHASHSRRWRHHDYGNALCLAVRQQGHSYASCSCLLVPHSAIRGSRSCIPTAKPPWCCKGYCEVVGNSTWRGITCQDKKHTVDCTPEQHPSLCISWIPKQIHEYTNWWIDGAIDACQREDVFVFVLKKEKRLIHGLIDKFIDELKHEIVGIQSNWQRN